MASLYEMPAPGRRRSGVYSFRNHNPKTDMTPMVDLGFLLIAFFIITTVLNKPVIAPLNMPHDGPPMPVEMSNSLTVLLGDNNTVYYYHGDMKQALASGNILKSGFDVNRGIGQVIREKQQFLERTKITNEGKKGLMLLVKPGAMANYSDLVKMLDEILINDVKKYAIVKPEPEEIEYVNKQSEKR